MHGRSIDVHHRGKTETALTNRSDRPVTWIAQFERKKGRLLADGKPVPANAAADFLGRTFLSTRLTVEPGTKRTVQYTSSP